MVKNVVATAAEQNVVAAKPLDVDRARKSSSIKRSGTAYSGTAYKYGTGNSGRDQTGENNRCIEI